MQRVIDLYNTVGLCDYIGERVSIKAHCEQAAALAAAQMPEDEEVVLAALLHDVGHLVGMEADPQASEGMGGCGFPRHEEEGAVFLASLGFSERICFLVRSHVQAKRYLVFKDPEYILSDASRTTLGYQGGAMSQEEATVFEQSADFAACLAMRKFDEAAKDNDISVPDIATYRSLMEKHSSRSGEGQGQRQGGGENDYFLSQPQIEHYRRNQWLKVPNLVGRLGQSPAALSAWIEDISRWEPHVEGKWLIHFELVGDKKQLCRAENFVDFHSQLDRFCRGGLRALVGSLFEQEAVLFKEKINFKLPGGAGFAAHQDSPAYIGLADRHISVLVAVDEFTEANGCLQVAQGGGWEKGQVALTTDGVVTPEAEAGMTWRPLECHPGDVVLFSGYLPHRSESNTTASSRRGLFLTYNPRSEGDLHAEYYRAKHDGALGFSSGAKISFQNDFKGVVVD